MEEDSVPQRPSSGADGPGQSENTRRGNVRMEEASVPQRPSSGADASGQSENTRRGNVRMEEDSVPQRPSSGADASDQSATTGNIRFTTSDGAQFDISSQCGKLGNNVMIGTGHNMVVNRDSDTRKRRKAKKPLTENKEEPRPHLLQNTTEKLTMEEAIMLGRVLTLSDAKIDEIKVDNHVTGASEIKYQILAEWLKKDENPTIATLAWALNKIERGDISDRLPR